MTSTPDPGQAPQDRRRSEPDEPPGARASMPVIGENGIETTPRPAPTPQPTDREPMATDEDGPTIVSVFGDARRAGRWRAGRQVRSFSVFGDTVLDLREADFAGGEFVVDAATLFGDTKILVPPGAQVDLGGFSLFGDHKFDHRPGTPPVGFPRVRVTGWNLFGDVKVMSLEIGEEPERWWRRLSSGR